MTNIGKNIVEENEFKKYVEEKSNYRGFEVGGNNRHISSNGLGHN